MLLCAKYCDRYPKLSYSKIFIEKKIHRLNNYFKYISYRQKKPYISRAKLYDSISITKKALFDY